MFETGVIPAAGAGMRLFPYSAHTPKALYEIGGKTLLERNIEILRDKLKVKRVIIITGHLGRQIEERFGDGSAMGIPVQYVRCRDIASGLARGLLLVENLVDGPFPVILGDELYLGSNHELFTELHPDRYDVACAVKRSADASLICKNYSVNIEKELIRSLTEKPTRVENDLLGCGTYIFKPDIFEFIRAASPSPRTRRVELTDVINDMAQSGKRVVPVMIGGEYRNVNEPDDYNSAVHLYRNAVFDKCKTSLVIPAWNEQDSIGHVIEEFGKTVDEIVVAVNESDDDTAKVAQEAGARVISGRYRGYGDAIRKGIEAATGDIFIIVEADATFSAGDIPKFLAYLRDADMVIGTRTTDQMIQQGANMDFILRWGNIFAAKILELLFWFPNPPRFTDLGCTYRAIWRDAYETILPNLKADGPEFSPEMMVEILRARRKVIEIPVTYRPRIGGRSKHSGGLLQTARTGARMMALILRKRFTSVYRRHQDLAHP